MYSILQGRRNWPGRPGNCQIKVSLNVRLNVVDEKDVFCSYHGIEFQGAAHN